jgi:hypothetical protein
MLDAYDDFAVAFRHWRESAKRRTVAEGIGQWTFVQVNTVIRQKLALETPSGEWTARVDHGPARSIRDRFCRTHSQRCTPPGSVRGGQALRNIRRAVGGRSVYCMSRNYGCEAALPHRAERASPPAYCLLPAACRLRSRAVDTAVGRGHWHGTATTNIWERCTGGYRKSQRGALAELAGRERRTGRRQPRGALSSPLHQASADYLREPRATRPSLG